MFWLTFHLQTGV